MVGEPLGGAQIRDLLLDVAQRLPEAGPRHQVVLVGGSLLAWHGLRETTHDIDTVTALDPELVAAAAAVAAERGLDPGWLNAASAGFAPLTLDPQQCETLAEHPHLRVLGAPLDQLFLMKLFAARARDLDDLRVLWPLTGYASAQEAVSAFHTAYPHEPDDQNLTDFIAALTPPANRQG